MAGRLILARHGETVANVARILDTALPGAELTDAGRDQARRLGATLSSERVVGVLSSQALRAQQTSEGVDGALGIGYDIREDIYEVQAGDLEGRDDEDSHTHFLEVYRSWYDGHGDARFPGGESGREVLDRYLPVIEDLRRSALHDGDIVVVSHGAVIRWVAANLADVSASFATTHHLRNTDTVVLSPTGGGRWDLERWGTAGTPDEPTATDEPLG